MKLDSRVELTYVQVILKIGYTDCDRSLLYNVGGETQGGAIWANRIGVLK